MRKKETILSGTSLKEKMKTLKEVKVDDINWKIFYTDILLQEKWVKEYPHSEKHGGGSPILKKIEQFPWE